MCLAGGESAVVGDGGLVWELGGLGYVVLYGGGWLDHHSVLEGVERRGDLWLWNCLLLWSRLWQLDLTMRVRKRYCISVHNILSLHEGLEERSSLVLGER